MVVAVVKKRGRRRRRRRRRGEEKDQNFRMGSRREERQSAAPCREPMHGRVFSDALSVLIHAGSFFLRFLFSRNARRTGCHVMCHVILSRSQSGNQKASSSLPLPPSQPPSLLPFSIPRRSPSFAHYSVLVRVSVHDNAVHAPCAMPLLV